MIHPDANPLAWDGLRAVRGYDGAGAEYRTFDIKMALCAPEDPAIPRGSV
jgi:hypothetical protein